MPLQLLQYPTVIHRLHVHFLEDYVLINGSSTIKKKSPCAPFPPISASAPSSLLPVQIFLFRFGVEVMHPIFITGYYMVEENWKCLWLGLSSPDTLWHSHSFAHLWGNVVPIPTKLFAQSSSLLKFDSLTFEKCSSIRRIYMLMNDAPLWYFSAYHCQSTIMKNKLRQLRSPLTNTVCTTKSNNHTNICQYLLDATFHESPAVFCLSEYKIISRNVVLF